MILKQSFWNALNILVLSNLTCRAQFPLSPLRAILSFPAHKGLGQRELCKRDYALNDCYHMMIATIILETLQLPFPGLNRSCSIEGFSYDECDRRCRCINGTFTDCHRIRKDFMEMPLEERRRYVKVLKVVSTQDPYKKTYDLVTRLHPKFFDIIHQRPLFFPWHRWYLFIFENLLRHVDCRVTVPYWNWARAVSRNRLWRATDIRDIWNPGPHGLGGDGEGKSRTSCVRNGPFQAGKWSLPEWLFSKCLSRRFDHRYYLPSEEYVKDLKKLSWRKFRAFESGVRRYMHNDLHNAVGGTMSEDESASAPEFWSHHAFLDKIWSDWQDQGPKYKFAYYKSINVLLPGGNHFGWQFMDLQNQPHCIRVLYEEPKGEKVPDGVDDNRVRYDDDVNDDDDDDDNGIDDSDDNDDDDNDDDDDEH